MSETISLGIPGLSVPPGTHICAFYSGATGRDEIVVPFLAEGIRAGQRCICILDTLRPADVLARLSTHVDPGDSVQTGQLTLGTPVDAYLASGQFRTEDMLRYWQHEAKAPHGPYVSFARVAGEMPSVLDNPDGRAEFFRYESMLNVAAGLPEVILCLYDLERYGAAVMMNVLQTHPRVIVNNTIRNNPDFIEPSLYLARKPADD